MPASWPNSRQERPAQTSVALGLLGCRGVAGPVDRDSLPVAAMPGGPSDGTLAGDSVGNRAVTCRSKPLANTVEIDSDGSYLLA